MSIIMTISEGKPTYTAEQMWLLLAALAEHPKLDLNIRERGELEDEDDAIGPAVQGPSDYLKASVKRYACPRVVGYSVGEEADPYTFAIDVRMVEVASQEVFNGEYVTVRSFYYAQHDGWDMDTQQYVEQWFHIMQLRLNDAEPNVSIRISGG